jgi:Major tropism determinant N-terminal domain
MAVVQISRIQIRRGQANSGSGLPQLASGEMAWAIDTQELYIGNGAVSEGAPAVGNTKIITENDFSQASVLSTLLQYSYKSSDVNIVTGVDANNPVLRYLQNRLDDQVNLLDFITPADVTSGNYSTALQRAVNQLFLNPASKSSNNTADGYVSRVELQLPAGEFNFSSTLYIPSYATIVGVGSEKTILNYTGTGVAIQFVNDTSSIGSPSSISSTFGVNQPRYVTLKGLSIYTSTANQTCLQLDCVRNSIFDDLNIKGNWGNVYNANSKGIALNAVSSIVTCENNTFTNITITGFSYPLYSKQDVLYNTFTNFSIFNSFKGISFGEGSNGTTIGQQFGPSNNIIENFAFTNILEHAIYIERGINNNIQNIQMDNVGNNGGGHVTITYPQIYFGQYGNISSNIRSDRTADLANNSYYITTITLTLSANVTVNQGAYVIQPSTGAYGYVTANVTSSTTIILQGISVQAFNTSGNLTINSDTTPSDANSAVHPTAVGSNVTSSYIPYLPEIAGHGEFNSFGQLQVAFGSPSSYTSAFRLPVSTDQYSDPQGAIRYSIDYQYKSITNPFTRKGTLFVSADIDNAIVKLSDEYDFIGTDSTGLNAIKLEFRVRFLDNTGATYTGALGQVPSSIDVQYINTMSSDNGTFTYTYNSSF